MIPTLDFLLPSLHPSTLLDVSFPLTAPGTTGEPVVRHLSIKHGEHAPVGSVKRMLSIDDGRVLVADDAFRLSSLQMPASGITGPPEVMSQETVAARAGNTWTGLAAVKGYVPSVAAHLSSLADIVFQWSSVFALFRSRVVPPYWRELEPIALYASSRHLSRLVFVRLHVVRGSRERDGR